MNTFMTEKPLLPPGLHDLQLSDIDNHFLSKFPMSTTRKPLIDGLEKFVSYLQGVGVPIELWIDGSFTTSKLNPNDIDLVIFSPSSKLNSLTNDKKRTFANLTDRASVRKRFGCDVLFCPAEDMNVRSYWRGWYGLDRKEQPKGIARLVIVK